MKNATIYIMFILLGCCCIYIWADEGREAPRSPVSVQTAPEQQVMSIRELQTFLNEKGHSRYKCEIDGRIGPETLKAWSNYICDRQSIKEF